jgi:hypothetical protein
MMGVDDGKKLRDNIMISKWLLIELDKEMA